MVFWLPYSSHTSHHPSQTAFLESLMLLKSSCSIRARCSKSSLKYSIRSSKVSSRPDCIFEIHQLWQLGFSRVYSNCCCSCSFEPEIIKITQSSHKMYSNNILNFKYDNFKCLHKKVWKLIEGPRKTQKTNKKSNAKFSQISNIFCNNITVVISLLFI